MIFVKNIKKFLVTGAISKFDGHIFSFDFKNTKTSLYKKCFYPRQKTVSDDYIKL